MTGMQTYTFLVAVTGEDVQDLASEIRERVIDSTTNGQTALGVDVHVTESVRVTP